MNLSNFGINAYKTTAKSESSENNSEKKVFTPIFEKISSTKKENENQGFYKSSFSSENKKTAESGQHKTMNEIFDKRFFPHLSDKDFQGNESARIAAKALTSGGLIKVPEQPREKDGKENIYRRVAKFLMLIGVDEAAKILPHLTDEQTEKIIPEIASIRYVEPDEAKEILEEFQGLVKQAREEGGIDTARTILEKAFGTHKAGVILEKTATQISGKPFEYLAEADCERVSFLLKDESNAVKALVLSYLNPKVSAQVINGMETEDKKDVVMRLAKLTKISPEIVQRVDKALQEKMNHLATSKSDSIDGKNILAQILKRMSPEAEEGILANLAEADSALGEDLRERLFTTEDIINADDRFIQDKLRDMDEEEIAYLIASKAEDFRAKILDNVSENRRKSILETEKFLYPMRKSDCEKATSQFFSTLRRAYEEGNLYIKGRDDELYV
ncbi:MAG: flagellar motor switch protein FliG [Treponema sp.]|uniref:flagellar motor switch protein FliG n=1 Tax=Treponema sp. TaxID=166 RepID=UPI002A916411|nr:flagellar motor switch protein FliG [Treponema sp.]MDY6396870.1 flagellar motor switch protein FliG [Treponema sp.]